MKTGMALACLFGLLCGAATAAAPADKSLKAYEEAKATAAAKVEVALRKQFETELKLLGDLKGKLYRVGDHVDVTVVEGRQRPVSGKFDGIKDTTQGQYAVIDGQNYLLTDLDRRSRNLLLYGAKPELLAKFTDDETKRLETEMAGRRKQMVVVELTRIGYDDMFLNHTLQMAGRFHTAEDLGLNLVEVQVEISLDAKQPCGLIKVSNRINSGKTTPLPSIGVVMLTNRETKETKELGATTADASTLVADAWSHYACYVTRKDLGADPMATVVDRMVLQFAAPTRLQGAWSARLRTARPPDTTTMEVALNDGTKKTVQCRRGVFKLQLLPESLVRLSDEINVLEIKNRILRATNYQREAEFEWRKSGHALPLIEAKRPALDTPKAPEPVKAPEPAGGKPVAPVPPAAEAKKKN